MPGFLEMLFSVSAIASSHAWVCPLEISILEQILPWVFCLLSKEIIHQLNTLPMSEVQIRERLTELDQANSLQPSEQDEIARLVDLLGKVSKKRK
jgi:hypothetical protein